jgi:hypothetical protein
MSGLSLDVALLLELNVLSIKVATPLFGNGLAMLLPLIGLFLNTVMDMECRDLFGTMSDNRRMQ